ncbi:uncharacterized protein KY384_006733 [Bacidia gigantensis]|uniref:uncharacterized protein n=1 Tax=Bacidia gigantensis TaxID=2732470 RepID=UPI001D058897|nr:uncharacterized protein KY384_006733 [Bacidia gigantensis]KAG8528561.1 hypothetical protein KY384_006733 [Bacidia gigantensis]
MHGQPQYTRATFLRSRDTQCACGIVGAPNTQPTGRASAIILLQKSSVLADVIKSSVVESSTSWLDLTFFSGTPCIQMVPHLRLKGNISDTFDVETSLFSLDLSSSFPLNGMLRNSYFHNDTIFVETTPRSIEGPTNVTGAFWTNVNQSTLYTVGGYSNNDMSQSALPAYSTQDDVWSSVNVAGGRYNKDNRDTAMVASTAKGGGSLSFIAGGIDYIQGMVIFNSSDPSQPSWENVTDIDVPYFWDPTTQYLRYGEAGILVSIGGWESEWHNSTGVQLRDMSSIQIYDIAGRRWFTVFATGNIPPPRGSFCSGISAAPDDSSFQMLIYGGVRIGKGTLSDTYSLVMPAFEWIKINTTAEYTPLQNSSLGRGDHFCDTYQDRQLIVLGGQDGEHANETPCDQNYPAMKMLDTTTYEWQTQWPLNDTKYRVPPAVISIVGGGPDGGARPALSWQETLGNNVEIFNRTIPRYDPDHPSQNVNLSGPSVPPPISRDKKKTSGATSRETIIGVAVGGSIGVAVLSGICYFIGRKRGYHKQSKEFTWQKAELSAKSSHPLAGQMPHTTVEVHGDDPQGLRTRELDDEQSRLEAPAGAVRYELPELYVSTRS